ncbi:hypothetical protein [Sporolactobacillus spathodeae]|uniref:Uncharacterized protein n=1 Tax=Sporolactobacillus spathodeae TaxID=1465502 RepID=A0ABS2QAL9_9BACL|nr:hypothetical protein [Sporolactobacillus spathodeae]MBM7658838.1 hypothetical protein [Sporolactobacillus spathodeae]
MAQYNDLVAFMNQPVEIQLADGTTQVGIVESVDQETVFLKPLDTNGTQAEQPEMRDSRFIGPFFPGAFLGGFAGGLLGVGLGNIVGVRPGPWWGACGPGPCGPWGPGGWGPGPWGPGPWGPRPW